MFRRGNDAPSGEGIWTLIQGLLLLIGLGGLALLARALFAGLEEALAVQYINAGIATVYTAITGAILVENRRMRIQTIQPHIQLVSHSHSDAGMTLELQNSGAGPAVDVAALAWVLDKVGNDHTARAALYSARMHAISVGAPTRLILTKVEDADQAADFKKWQALFKGARASVTILDPNLLLLSLVYKPVGGRTAMSNCTVVALQAQPQVKAD